MTLYPWRQYGKNTTEEIASQVESQWETPGGAQEKADKAEENAKEYADENFAKNAFSKVASPGRATVESEDKEDTLTLEAGTGIAITTDPAQKKVTIWTQGDSAPGAHGETHNHDGSDPIPDLVQLRDDFDAHKEDKNNPHNVKSDQVNLLPLNSFNFDDPGTLYPGGVTTFSITEANPGWPATAGMVTTFKDLRNDLRTVQIIFDAGGGSVPPNLWIRNHRIDISGTGWSNLAELLHTGNTTNIVNQDYETGEWTPVLEGLDVPGNHTYSVRRGNYHIIGDRVFVSGELRITSSGFDSNVSGGIVISGLPFAQRDSANDSTAFAIGVRSGIDQAKPVYGYMGRGENVLSLLSGWASERVRITHEDLSAPIHISFSGHYRI